MTQRKILSLVSSVFDPIGLLAPFSVHMRQLLKGIWTKNGQHWDNEVDPSEEEEFLRWKEQLPLVAETSIDRRYFNRERDKTELHVFADASEDTICAVAYLRSQPKEYAADLAFVIGKCRVAPMRHLSIPRLELQAAVMAVRLKEQIVKEHEMKINSCSFWSDSTTILQWIHSSHRKQQVFVANRVAKILDTTDVSQWKHASGINIPADIGTRAINVEELKRSEWLTGPFWLKRPESEWPEQVNLIFASDEENIPSSVFMIQAEEKKAGKEVCLNDKLLAGPYLLHGLIGTIFRFREGAIALTADIESMFLQVQVPEQDRSCLRFLWRPRTNEPVQIYEYQRHVFGAKSCPTCANYALKQVGLDNEKEYPIAAKTIQNNF